MYIHKLNFVGSSSDPWSDVITHPHSYLEECTTLIKLKRDLALERHHQVSGLPMSPVRTAGQWPIKKVSFPDDQAKSQRLAYPLLAERFEVWRFPTWNS